MTVRIRHCSLALALVLATTAFSVPARAANILEMLFYMTGPRYDAVVPLCDNSSALSKIQGRFAAKEGGFWNSDLAIVGFENVRETSFMPWGHDTIPRRFCSAIALVSDGIKRPVYYSIAEDTGMIGMLPGVEWCVVGLDRNWAFNPRCKMAKP
jgi:hypothetical protein